MTHTSGGFGSCRQLLAPAQILGGHARVQDRLEERELVSVAEHDLGHARSVDRAVLAEDSLTQLADERLADVGVLAEQVMDDLVARDRGGPGFLEREERLALARTDAAGDGDRDRQPG